MISRIFRFPFLPLLVLLFPGFPSAQTLGQGLDPFPRALAAASPRATPNSLAGAASLPPRADLSAFLPPIRSQGAIGSCAAWATIYYARTLLEQKERGWGVSTPDHQLAPLYTYNQITLGKNEGTAITSHMALLKDQGIVSLADFPYVDRLDAQPDETLKARAAGLKIADFKSLPRRGEAMDLEAVKSFLAQGFPVVGGFELFEDFPSYRGGVYRTTSGTPSGGHAMAIVGYDDAQGALRIVNSWGPQWGDGGYLWLSYESVAAMTRVNYGCAVMFDLVDTPQTPSAPTNLSASQGESEDSISLSWQVPEGAERVVVLRADNATRDWKEMASTTEGRYTDTPLPPGVAYVYSVRAERRQGSQTLSSPLASLVEGSTRKKATVPGVVRGLSFSDDGGGWLRWPLLTDTEFYQIFRFDSASQEFVLVGTSSRGEFRDPGAFAGVTEATWFVRGLNSQGAGLPSPSLTVVRPRPSPIAPAPAAPKVRPVVYDGAYQESNWFDPRYVDRAFREFAAQEKAAFEAWKSKDQSAFEAFLQRERQ